jgi:hypothetical protein
MPNYPRGMPEQLLIREPLSDQPQPDPRAWRSVAFLLVLLGCLAVTVFVLVAVVSPAAGAAGGCGGG